MSGVLNKIISRLKGNTYKIDPRVPSGYLFFLLLKRMMMFLRGLLSGISNHGMLFIGRNVTIKASRYIKTGRTITIDDNCYLDALSVEGLRLGNNVSIGKNTTIECTGNLQFLGKGMEVGNNAGLGSDNFFGCAGGISIGDDTIIGNFVSFHSENHVYNDPVLPIRLQGVTHAGIIVGNNCWLGAKCTILDGAVIGNGCIIAAGALVIAGKYEDNGIYGGVPAKFIKYRIQ